MSDSALPTLSIVTPSFNQARFLEETIRSVLAQAYPRLEFVIVDGGSTDASTEIIRRYSERLAFWISESDQGQYDALNKGFARTSGEVMAWINSDDMYTPWAFSVVGEVFARFPEVEWLTTLFPLVWDERGRAVACFREHGFTRRGFLKGDNLSRPGVTSRRWIQQESTFWRRSLWERAGSRLDSSLTLAGDFELWARFFEHADLYGVESPLGGFRSHGHQRSLVQEEQYRAEALQVLKCHRGRPRSRASDLLHARLLDPLPPRLRRIAGRLGIVSPHHICRYLGPSRGWTLATE